MNYYLTPSELTEKVIKNGKRLAVRLHSHADYTEDGFMKIRHKDWERVCEDWEARIRSKLGSGKQAK